MNVYVVCLGEYDDANPKVAFADLQGAKAYIAKKWNRVPVHLHNARWKATTGYGDKVWIYRMRVGGAA